MAQYELNIEADVELKKEIQRTLGNLFATRAGSQPADRDFGIDWECLDEPPEVAESLFYLEALKKVEKYEPRVEISDMQFENTQGSMTVYIGFAVTGEL